MASKRIGVTRHATDRAIERIGIRNRATATSFLREAWTSGTKLPFRYGQSLQPKLSMGVPKKERSSYRVWGNLLLVGRPGVVITVWKLTEEQLASVLVWGLVGIWVA